MRATTAFCLVIGVIAIGVGSATARFAAPRYYYSQPDTFQVEMVQGLAESSCRCERRASPGQKEDCWAAFHRKMPRSGFAGTACAPISEEQRCGTIKGPAGHTDACITVRYEYVGSIGPAYLCTRNEAMAVEAAWYSELVRRNRDRKSAELDFSTPQTDQMVRDLMANKPIDLAPKRGVCASS